MTLASQQGGGHKCRQRQAHVPRPYYQCHRLTASSGPFRDGTKSGDWSVSICEQTIVKPDWLPTSCRKWRSSVLQNANRHILSYECAIGKLFQNFYHLRTKKIQNANILFWDKIPTLFGRWTFNCGPKSGPKSFRARNGFSGVLRILDCFVNKTYTAFEICKPIIGQLPFR